MQRSILERILAEAPGVEGKDGTYQVEEKHRVSLYVGEPGQAMVFAEIDSIALEDEYVRIVARDTGANLFVLYEAIHGVGDRPPSKEQGRRAGFN
ncbi:MAG: hypothetical protein OEY14_09920 [Myxococcales bacterium]|nr:hypothetical protein [Myxococcales bacterium]